MRESFDKAFELTIGLEGKPTDDPRDPGGFTIWGLASKFNPGVSRKTTLAEAKAIYLKKYWGPACDEAPFPLDICLFDSAVNPQRGGNKELLDLNPANWQEYNLQRMIRYMKYSKPEYVKGHVMRVLKLSESIIKLVKEGEEK